MLTSKQRAKLRSQANDMETILQVGKDGIGDTLLKQIDDALTAREMIKIRVLNNQELTSREIADEISSQVDCDVVQVIGTRIVLFRRNSKKGAYDFCL
ncbi:MAG: ribosome assembly RNA-binding protein YhbY [Ruminococcaceae bacterium]|nr:ribosome assembly RNA-binding protein YhbY [Oscillospiraceae bacterium]